MEQVLGSMNALSQKAKKIAIEADTPTIEADTQSSPEWVQNTMCVFY